jgi:hypothetical protein
VNLDHLLAVHANPVEDPKQRLKVPGVYGVEARYGSDLRALRVYHPDLIIAGGAVRDLLFGKPVKDVDYLTASEATASSLAHLWDLKMVSDPSYQATDLVFQDAGKTRDVILVADLWNRIGSFPDSISQCWFDGTYVYGTSEFMRTYMTEIITHSTSITDERLQRIRAKYPEFVLEGNDFF